MGVFVIALSFVFVFVPGMLEPFSASTQTETPAVNRVVDDLTQRTLGSASEPYVLEERCTREFFLDTAPPSDCNFGDGTTAERVGINERTPVNVTVSGNLTGTDGTNVVCWNPDSSSFIERDDTDCDPASGDSDIILSRGPEPGGSGGKTVSATRVALLGDHDVTVEVVMW